LQSEETITILINKTLSTPYNGHHKLPCLTQDYRRVETMTLWQLPAGSSATIAALDEKLDSRYRQRIRELGFSVGATVRCILQPGLGAPRQYAINNSVYSLDRQVADAIVCKAQP